MTILLLEDEDPAAARLHQLLAQAAPQARVLAVLDTVAGALAWLATHPAPDLILSDIQLADGLSFDIFARAVVRSPVIFTTAYDQYAIRAFEANSIAYLLKPVKLPELTQALAKWQQWPARPAGSAAVGVKSEELTEVSTAPEAVSTAAQTESEKLRLLSAELLTMLTQNSELKTQNSPHKTRFLVRQGEALLPLPAAEAAWFQSRHETTTLATFDGRRFVVDYTLEQLEALLDPAQFFRLSRQVLAQLPAVRRLVPHLGGKLLAELSPALPTGTEALVSREKAGPLRRWLEGLA